MDQGLRTRYCDHLGFGIRAFARVLGQFPEQGAARDLGVGRILVGLGDLRREVRADSDHRLVRVGDIPAERRCPSGVEPGKPSIVAVGDIGERDAFVRRNGRARLSGIVAQVRLGHTEIGERTVDARRCRSRPPRSR